MTWTTYKEPPSEVGLVRYRNESRDIEFMAQWDGRMFRHASGLLAGMPLVPKHGDEWSQPKESA